VTDPILKIKPISHKSPEEKNLFIEWFYQIPSVRGVKEKDNVIEVHFNKEEIPEDDQHDLAAIFYRFKMDIEPLNELLKKNGTGWLFKQNGNPNHHNVWPNKEKPGFAKEALVCGKIDYFSQLDESLFFIWLDRINSVINREGIKQKLYLHVKKEDLTEADYQELKALFELYGVDTKQLKTLKKI